MNKIDPFGSDPPLVDMSVFPSWIIFEDDALLILNKPGWLVCHPSKDGPLSSLVGAVRMYNNLDKLHLVARLDRETSGLVVIAKRPSVARKFQMAIQERKVEKEYLVILDGTLKNGIKVNQSIAHRPNGLVKIKNHVSNDRTAKTAVTVFEPLLKNEDYTLARVFPETGRKHQIRVHAEWLGHSVVGDKIYGPDESLYIEFIEQGWTDRLNENLAMKRQALHCHKYHFKFSDGPVIFEAPLAEDMDLFCQKNLNEDFSLSI
jgi:23S rRNA pseudouridine1911/1915/1917 synthase